MGGPSSVGNGDTIPPDLSSLGHVAGQEGGQDIFHADSSTTDQKTNDVGKQLTEGFPEMGDALGMEGFEFTDGEADLAGRISITEEDLPEELRGLLALGQESEGMGKISPLIGGPNAGIMNGIEPELEIDAPPTDEELAALGITREEYEETLNIDIPTATISLDDCLAAIPGNVSDIRTIESHQIKDFLNQVINKPENKLIVYEDNMGNAKEIEASDALQHPEKLKNVVILGVYDRQTEHFFRLPPLRGFVFQDLIANQSSKAESLEKIAENEDSQEQPRELRETAKSLNPDKTPRDIELESRTDQEKLDEEKKHIAIEIEKREAEKKALELHIYKKEVKQKDAKRTDENKKNILETEIQKKEKKKRPKKN